MPHVFTQFYVEMATTREREREREKEMIITRMIKVHVCKCIISEKSDFRIAQTTVWFGLTNLRFVHGTWAPLFGVRWEIGPKWCQIAATRTFKEGKFRENEKEKYLDVVFVCSSFIATLRFCLSMCWHVNIVRVPPRHNLATLKERKSPPTCPGDKRKILAEIRSIGNWQTSEHGMHRFFFGQWTFICSHPDAFHLYSDRFSIEHFQSTICDVE